MTHIGVADALQLLIHIYSGVLVIVNADMSAISNKVSNGLNGDACVPYTISPAVHFPAYRAAQFGRAYGERKPRRSLRIR